MATITQRSLPMTRDKDLIVEQQKTANRLRKQNEQTNENEQKRLILSFMAM